MPRTFPLRRCLRTCVLVSVALLGAAARGEAPAPWRDDADLHAVQLVGKSVAWAVGDHGAALRSLDGGKSWESRPLTDDLSLRAVSFLDQDHGWVAGGTTVPYTGLEIGAVYATADAGHTWRRVNADPLPRLHAIRFFSRNDGLAAGASSPECPSGVLSTRDGGATWRPFETAAVLSRTDLNPSGWRSAAFHALDRGVVVGPRGHRAAVGGDQLLPSRNAAPGLRGLHGVALADAQHGWAAGDGGMILRTKDAGLVWEPATLPDRVSDLFDFRAVAAAGERVWVAGRPGSLVWHSPDSGGTWLPQPTGSPLPIQSMHFATSSDGVAVGAMGRILQTADGGTTWQAVRGANHHAALMAIAARPRDVSYSLLAEMAGDQGYRSVVVLPTRHDLRAGDAELPNLDLRTHDAVASTGANSAVTDWPLPLAVPGLDRDIDALVAAWNRRTEGKLERVLVGRLVAAIRTWRPEVLVLEEPAAGDALGRLVFEAAQLAIPQAADSTQHTGQQPALVSWQVKKVYVRSSTAGAADAVIEPDRVLPRLGIAAAELAHAAASCIGGLETESSRELFRLLPARDGRPLAKPFFADLALAPGSAARRAVGDPVTDADSAELAQRRRNIRAYIESSFDDPRNAAGMLAQLDEISAGLPAPQAARQLHRIADRYRRNSQWDLAEQTCLALVERFPAEPPAREAMIWLLQLWTGSEPVWRRMKDVGTTTTRAAGSVETLPGRIEKALQMAEQGTHAVTSEQIAAAGLGPDPIQLVTARGEIKIDAVRHWDDATVAHWRQQSLRLGSLLRQIDPALFATPEVQFPLAVAVRTAGGSAAAYFQRYAANGGGGWQPIASAELTLARPGGSTQVQAAICRRAAEPPHLDAVFSDPCWQAAKALDLASEAGGSLGEGGLVLLSYDERFLYVAASVPRSGRLVPEIELAGRTHDATLSNRDRLLVTLDRDRDYATYFQFGIAESGETSESCWGDESWNPRWFVAVDGDADRWRLEAAIPFSTLGPRPPAAGEIWSLSLSRIVPAEGVQGWPRANDGEPRPESFGLLRFE